MLFIYSGDPQHCLHFWQAPYYTIVTAFAFLPGVFLKQHLAFCFTAKPHSYAGDIADINVVGMMASLAHEQKIVDRKKEQSVALW